MDEDLLSKYQLALSKATKKDKDDINKIMSLTNECIDLIYFFERDKPTYIDNRLCSLACNNLEMVQLYCIKMIIKNTCIEDNNE